MCTLLIISFFVPEEIARLDTLDHGKPLREALADLGGMFKTLIVLT